MVGQASFFQSPLLKRKAEGDGQFSTRESVCVFFVLFGLTFFELIAQTNLCQPDSLVAK